MLIARKKEIKTRNLLKEGLLSERAIAKIVGISRKTVAVIKKSPKLRKRLPIRSKSLIQSTRPYKCKLCGGRVKTRPCVMCHLRVLSNGTIRSQEMQKFPEAFRVIMDIWSLHELNLILHPLFCDLANRAGQVLNAYNFKRTHDATNARSVS